MPRERRKAPRQMAPQTKEEATRLLTTYVALLDELETEKAVAQAEIDRIVGARDAALQPIEDELKKIFRQLRPWWAGSKDELTDGKRKSIELVGAQIGERTTTPALCLPKGMKLDDFVEWLQNEKLTDLIRTTHKADKPACIAAIRMLNRPKADKDCTDSEFLQRELIRRHGEALRDKGVTVTQRDEFFIDRADKASEKPKLVAVESEGEAA